MAAPCLGGEKQPITATGSFKTPPPCMQVSQSQCSVCKHTHTQMHTFHDVFLSMGDWDSKHSEESAGRWRFIINPLNKTMLDSYALHWLWKRITVMTTLSQGSILRNSDYSCKNAPKKKKKKKENPHSTSRDDIEMMHNTVDKSTMPRLAIGVRYVYLRLSVCVCLSVCACVQDDVFPFPSHPTLWKPVPKFYSAWAS